MGAAELGKMPQGRQLAAVHAHCISPIPCSLNMALALDPSELTHQNNMSRACNQQAACCQPRSTISSPVQTWAAAVLCLRQQVLHEGVLVVSKAWRHEKSRSSCDRGSAEQTSGLGTNSPALDAGCGSQSLLTDSPPQPHMQLQLFRCMRHFRPFAALLCERDGGSIPKELIPWVFWYSIALRGLRQEPTPQLSDSRKSHTNEASGLLLEVLLIVALALHELGLAPRMPRKRWVLQALK